MCVIALKLGGSTISDEMIRSCWITNPDGGGFALSTDKRFVVKKGIMHLKDFIEEYRREEKKLKNPVALLHFRIRSSGDKSPENTHPFPIADGGVMAHNGTLNPWAHNGEKKSDTVLFVEEYGQDFTFAMVEKIKEELGEAIAAYNRLVFLWKGKKFSIVNEERGNWEQGIWFSNYSWKPISRRYSSNHDASNLAMAYGIDDY